MSSVIGSRQHLQPKLLIFHKKKEKRRKERKKGEKGTRQTTSPWCGTGRASPEACVSLPCACFLDDRIMLEHWAIKGL